MNRMNRMNRHLARMLLCIGLALGMAVAAVASGESASAVATVTVGLWNLNEAPGAQTAIDSSGNRQNGTVGSLVQTGVNGGDPHRFPTRGAGPAAPHPVLVPNNTPLKPGARDFFVPVRVRAARAAGHGVRKGPDGAAGDFSVQVRFRTTRAASNVVQKGQAGTAGGYWKVEIHNGLATCLFRGGNDQQRAVLSTTQVNNGAWHTVRCDRTADSVAIIIDGVRQKSLTGPSGSVANTWELAIGGEARWHEATRGWGGLGGSVANTWELAIGGKSRCNETTVGCDAFAGDIDYVRILKG